jgi:streptogramin lyase
MIATRCVSYAGWMALLVGIGSVSNAAPVPVLSPGDIVFNEFFDGWHKLDPTTNQVSQLPWPMLRDVVEIRFDTDGAILYDANDQIYRLHPTTGLVTSLNIPGLSNVDGFVVEPSGDLLIANSREVLRYTRSTAELTTVATASFFSPAGIDQGSDGRVFITEFFEHLLEINPATGNYSLVTSAEFSNPGLIAVRSDGDLIVENFSPDVLYRINPQTGERTLYSDDLPTFVSEFVLDDADNLWLTSTDGIYRYGSQGGLKTLVAADTFFSPKGIAVVPQGWTAPRVPEPATASMVLLTVGTLVCFRAGWRRQ